MVHNVEMMFAVTVTVSIGCVDYIYFEEIQVSVYVHNGAFSDLHSATEKLGRSLKMRLHHMQPIY